VGPATRTADERRERLASSRLYFVVEAQPQGRDAEALLRAALENGVDIVQLRDPSLDDEGILRTAREFRRLCDEHDALFILNDRPDLAVRCGADGVHLGQDDMPVREAREIVGPDPLIGLSTHSPEQIEAAEGADQISVGPVWATPTKPGRPATGLELIHRAARTAPVPFFAIGGIDSSNVADVVRAGAERVVVVRAIRDAEDPGAAARALRAALPQAQGDGGSAQVTTSGTRG
jgi:thiamine-phosphate pyrophosphorylase